MADAEFAAPSSADTAPELSTLTLVGELEDPDAVRDALRAASADYSRSLGVDLTAVTYLPSVVVGVLFGAMKNAELAGTSVVVAVEAGSIVHNILRITAMPHVVV